MVFENAKPKVLGGEWVRCFDIRKVVVLLMLIFAICAESALATNIDYKHWAEPFIDKKFYSEYLYDYSGSLSVDLLDRQMEKRLYQKVMKSMLLNLNNLDVKEDKSRDGDVEIVGIWENNLTRKQLAVDTIESLEEYDIKFDNDEPKKFIDIADLDKDEQKAINILSAEHILRGYSETEFKPDERVTYAQGIIVLQRIERIVKDKISEKQRIAELEKTEKERADRTKENVDEQNNTEVEKTDEALDDIFYTIYEGKAFSEGIFSKANKNKETGAIELEITIAKYFPSDDYNLVVADVIRESSGKYKILMNIEEPKLKDLTIEDKVLDAITIKIGGSYIMSDAENGSTFSFSVDFENNADN